MNNKICFLCNSPNISGATLYSLCLRVSVVK